MSKSEHPISLNELNQLYRNTTGGNWKSHVEGRDHSSGSNFIMTGEEDIELVGASVADQDFIAAIHSVFPSLVEAAQKPAISTKVLEEALKESLKILAKSGCINETELGVQYARGTETYEHVQNVLNSIIDKEGRG